MVIVMKIVNLLEIENKDIYLEKLKACDWPAGRFLAQSIIEGFLFKMCKEDAKVFMLLDEQEIVSFCTYVHQDEINAPSMYPWIGFVYTYPKYRGKRMMGILFDHIFSLAKKENHKQIYLSTNEVGLYEKYGFEYYKNMDDIQGNDSRIYVKKL